MEQIPAGYFEPTTTVIEDAIEALFNIQDTITTLEVRDYLRNKNYWVSCANVRPVLKNYIQYGYSISSHKDPTGTFTQYTCTPLGQVSTATVSSSPFSGLLEYEVYTPGTPSKRYQVHYRNEARYQYAQEFSVPYVDTRARRIVHV